MMDIVIYMMPVMDIVIYNDASDGYCDIIIPVMNIVIYIYIYYACDSWEFLDVCRCFRPANLLRGYLR
jgi:hypothetical protein